MLRIFGPNIKKLEKEENIEELQKCLLSKSAYARVEAFKALFALKGNDDEIKKQLRSLVDDKDPKVRSVAVLKFAEAGDTGIFDKLKVLIAEGSQKEKLDALMALSGFGQIENQEIVNMVLIALKDKSELVQSKALKTMGYVRHPHFIPALEDNLQNEHKGLRIESVKALGRIGGDAVIDSLITALMDKDKEVEKTARLYLREIGTPKALKALNDEKFMHLMKGMGGTLKERVETIKEIEQTKNREGLPLLMKVLSDTYKEVRLDAVKALRAFDDIQSITPIVKLLEDKYYDVRLEAVKTLSTIASREVLNALQQKAINDTNSHVKDEAERAVNNMKSKLV